MRLIDKIRVFAYRCSGKQKRMRRLRQENRIKLIMIKNTIDLVFRNCSDYNEEWRDKEAEALFSDLHKYSVEVVLYAMKSIIYVAVFANDGMMEEKYAQATNNK